jgi:hypothetical protein
VSGNSANNFDEGINYIPEHERKYASSSMVNSRFYPDLLRSSSTHGLAPIDVNSGSSSIDSDSTLVAVQDTDDLTSNMTMSHHHGWFNEMNPVWQTTHKYNNHYENYIPSHSSLQQFGSALDRQQFQHNLNNYNYADLDMSYRNDGNFHNLLPRYNKQQQQQWDNSNELNNHSKGAVVINQGNHHQVNDHHDHYHPLQTVGILFNGPANEHQQRDGRNGDTAVLVENAKRLQQKHQAFLGQAEFNKSLLSSQVEGGSNNQQYPSKINIYANSNWKQQHIDESGLATLPRRPFSAQPFYPYNTDLELPYNYNSHLMGGLKMNLSQSPSNAVGMPGTHQ